MTCIQKKRRDEECICVLQLTEAGDIFYQILEHERLNTTPRRSAAEDEPLSQQASQKTPQPPDSPLVVSETSSDETTIGPTQGPTVQRFVAETPERKRRAVNSDSEDSQSEGKHRNVKQWLQVVVNDDPEPVQVNILDTGVNDGKMDSDKAGDNETACGSGCMSHAASSRIKISQDTVITWKRWLQKLMQRSSVKNPRPQSLEHFTVETKGLLRLAPESRNSTQEERVQRLKQDLRACMLKRSLVVHSSVSNSLGAPDTVSVPNQVDTEVWGDNLSQRLTLSWQGEETWRRWWEDHLGMNREEKIKALRRKRSRDKEARRANSQRLELSGSFTSSVSYEARLDDFSNSTGWSSATSQEIWSESESMGPLSQLEDHLMLGTPRATASSVQNNTPDSKAAKSVHVHQSGQQTPSSSRSLSLSQTVKHDATPASQRRSRQPADNYLSSLFATQVRGKWCLL